MRAPVLCAVVVISLGLAGVLEFLAQKSQRQGGLALSSSEDDISESVNIAYLYMPTTVAVLYSLLWTWIDLDVRRMQPWFELSRPHGANAEQSLLLNYPFEFLAFVPFKAWKQRHWPVFITGSVMMLIFWAITPLQGAIFGQQAVTVSTSSVMDPGSGLVAVEEQAALIDVSILNSAYGTTLDAVTRRPLNDSLVELAPPSPLNNTLFNISAFEFLLHAGFSSLAIPRDYPNNLILDQYAKLYDSNISWPTTNMVGFAVGLHDGSLTDFLNTTVIQESYTAAHKLAFSLAISQLASRTANPETHSGVIEYAAFGVVVSRPFSVAVEILLVVVAFSALVLLYTIVRSPSNLTSDPDSIASLFGFIQKEDAVLSHLSTKDNLTEASLSASIRADRYHLTPTNDATGPTLQLLSSGNGPGTSQIPNGIPTLVSRTQTQSIRPKELRPIIGAPFVLVLAFAIGILARSPRTTIETKYDSLPPQLVVWRAVKAGHYFLAVLSVVVLMANVLAIGLGAIFNESPTSVLATRNVNSLVSPSLSRVDLLPERFATGKGTQYYDHFYIVQTNMSANTRLPPWIDAQFTYLPFSDLTSNDNSSAQYTAVTRGFGTEATCSMLPTDNSSLNRLQYSYNTTAGPATQQIIKAVYEDTPYGNTTKCMLPGFIDDAISGILPEGKSAHEFYSALEQEDVNTFKNASEEAVAFCEERLVLGWMRYDTSKAESGPDMTFLQCTTHLVTAQFSITVDADGYILRSERLGDYDNITEILGPSAANISHQANLLIGDKWHSSSTGAKYMWHNDSVTTDWMNYYLKIATNGTDLIDPDKPLPDAVRLIPIVQEIYQRIGAALLGANRDLFVESPQNQGSVLLATIETQDTKIFMDNTALVISLTILGIYLLVSILLYARQRRILLPRMPSTIGSTVAYAAGSRAVRLYNGPGKDGSARETYSFGRYLGIDGKAHIGIELDPYVFSLDQTSSLGGSKERLKNRV
ncbi:hypothetical protein SLS64_005234 [Diaporthe eres]